MGYLNILLIATLFGFILATLLIIKKGTTNIPSLLLAIFYFIFSIYCFQTYIIEFGLLKEYTWFYGWPLPLYALLHIPIYFYFIIIINGVFKWKWEYLLLLIPWLLSAIDVIILYSKPNSFYDEIIQNAIKNPNNRLNNQYGILSLIEHYTIRNLWTFICLASVFPILKKFRKQNSLQPKKTILKNWLLFLYFTLIILALLSTIFGIEEIYKINIFEFIFQTKKIGVLIIFIFYLLVLCIGIAPLYFPSILYNITPIRKKNMVLGKNTNLNESFKFGLDEIEIKNKLSIFEEEKKYLLQDFDLTMLAKELDIPAHQLSSFFNQYFSSSFASYRNDLRMKHAITLITNGFVNNNTIEALAWTCGFASRSSFSKTFKSFTGMNITEYINKTTPVTK